MSTSTITEPVTGPGGRHAPAAPRRPRPARRDRSVLFRLFTKVVAIVLLLAAWEFAPRAGLIDPTFLTPFSEVASALAELAANGQLAEHVQASLTRSLSGFGIAVLVAVPLGVLIGWYRVVSDVLTPLVQLFLNTAALALLPVFVLILGIGEASKIAIVIYACTWPILLNTISAVRNVDPTLLKLARSLDLPPLQLFGKVVLPASIPTIFTGLRLAGAAAIVVVIAAEMVGAKAGLGFLINDSQYNFAIPSMYAGIVAISVIGVGFNQLLVFIERRLTNWK
ncbi:ABC transporter permease [Prauserella cavernicola]|uniref:ABC transporter permease n=1 Tax=Prauserella cavernicola TaxID=2800127 RepID=A0A934V4P2_9PSEU|nr:ABC transporter permease [Prauserella cavernicola]MBK1783793.1 ABC transporter permease [Prauserella cavernicola]